MTPPIPGSYRTMLQQRLIADEGGEAAARLAFPVAFRFAGYIAVRDLVDTEDYYILNLAGASQTVAMTEAEAMRYVNADADGLRLSDAPMTESVTVDLLRPGRVMVLRVDG